MLQLLANDDPNGAVGKPAVVRSAAVSVAIHGLVILLVLSAAYWRSERLPDRLTRIMLVAPAPPVAPPAPAAVPRTARVAVSRPARVFTPVLTAPVAIPEHVAAIASVLDAPPEMEIAEGVVGGMPGGLPGGVLGGVTGGPAIPPPALAPRPVTPAPEPKAPEIEEPGRIEVDSAIQAGKLVTMIQPVYPPMARQARVQGDVRLTAIIDRTGKVTELKVLEGNPLLIGAARSAVERWRYRPTLLHGQPVEVVTIITVEFRLRSMG